MDSREGAGQAQAATPEEERASPAKQAAAKIVVEKGKETTKKTQKKKLSKEAQLREKKRQRRAAMIKELKQRQQAKMQQLTPANASNASLITSDGRTKQAGVPGKKSTKEEQDKKSQASRMKSCGRRCARFETSPNASLLENCVSQCMMVLKPKTKPKPNRQRYRTRPRRSNASRPRRSVRHRSGNASDDDPFEREEPEDNTPDYAPSVVNDTRPVAWLLCTGPSLFKAAPRVRQYIKKGDPVISLNKYLSYKNSYFYKKSKIM